MLTDEYKYLYNNITRIPKQIMNYQIALKMHKLSNEHDDDLSFEQVMVLDQIICNRRQINFQVMRKFNTKIGMNTTANKLYQLNNMIGLALLNFKFVHYKKLIKVQFLKNGRT